MAHTLVNPADSLERQNEKLLKIATTLMRRVEQSADATGVAYAQFERAAMLEEEVRARTEALERAIDLLNESNARLARANAETEAARADLWNAIETIQEGFALFNPQDELVTCNSRFGEHTRDIHHLFRPGLAYADYVRLVSQSPFLILPRGETPEIWAARRMERHRDDHVAFNARLAGARWLQVSEQRTPDGGTVVVQTDVTDMVRLERREREKLRDDQARLIRATLEHLNQGVCIFDGKDRLIGWNRRVGEFLSLPMGRFHVGTSFRTVYDQLKREVRFAHAFDAQILLDWVASDERHAPLSMEIEIGAQRVLTVFAQRMPDGGFVISFTDVSAERAAMRAISDVNETLERRVMERTLELEDALAEAERANASKSRFVAAASHDLLQPLSAAKLYIASIGSATDEAELKQRLDKAENALRSVEGILGALLDISKLDSGKAEVHLSDVRLDLLLRQMADELGPVAARKGLDFRIVLSRAVVRSDAAYLRRILQNLVSNAVRYTETGRVLVGVRRARPGVRLEVWDTGPGIPESQQEEIFAEFHRLNAAASAADGMGLGLAIVDRACRLLNHPLELVSQEGHGTRFAVSLPLASRPGADEIRPEDGMPAGSNLGQRIVLLIENDDELRNAVAVTLENWGVDVFPCANEAEAMALLEEVDIAPDVIVVDYQLDDGRLGTDAIIRLRARYGPLPACVISANRSSDLADLCERIGARLVHKPFDPGVLREFLLQSAG
ncbi:hybrid sensor histidine kinase/response regulator [Jhaorihella thermophila]|uniref:histidine kinase n=1 Tax=Jhaorihella thermophila TaxID=488547 RepID=A0A1H5S0C0_9RHOB|nr:PAS-domain containing protein [Jhaorihella thermophila]SEF43824.1 hypothetical protein SAMN05421751_101261 [Jhaorihella thermophila]